MFPFPHLTPIQVNDQKWQQGNLGLRLCFERGVPVRVVRAVAHGQEGGGKKGKQGADGKEGADRYS